GQAQEEAVPAVGRPRLVLSAEEVAFGKVKPEDAPRRIVEVRNAGNAPLRIERVGSSCACTAARLESRELAPGEATSLAIALHLSDYDADHVRTRVSLVTNDPERAEAA